MQIGDKVQIVLAVSPGRFELRYLEFGTVYSSAKKWLMDWTVVFSDGVKINYKEYELKKVS